MASPFPTLAGTLAIFKLRTMTLLTLFRPRPQPVKPELAPTPMIVLLDETLISLEHEKLPLTRTVCCVLDDAALVRADTLVTVTVGPLPPPVVPPDWVDQPSWLFVAADACGAYARAPAVIRARAAPPMNIGRHRRLRGAAAESGGAVAMMGTETSCVRRLGHGRRLHADGGNRLPQQDIHVDQLRQGRSVRSTGD